MVQRKFLTVQEACEFTGFSKSYIYKLVYYRKIPFYKPQKGKLLFDANELDKWIRAGRVPSDAELSEKASALLNGGAK